MPPRDPDQTQCDQNFKYIYIYSDKRFLQSTFYTNKKNQNIISDLEFWIPEIL